MKDRDKNMWYNNIWYLNSNNKS